MRVQGTFLCLVFISINLYADVKWISLEPQKPKQITKPDINISQLQPVKKLLENVKVIHYMLEKKGTKKEINPDSEKNWYIITNTQSD